MNKRMKKILFIILIIPTPFFNVFAQKEIYFSSTPKDSIKVESIRGVEIESGMNTSKLFNTSSHDKSFTIPLYMGYFNEKRIAPSWTLIARIGLSNNFMNSAHYVLVKDSMQMNGPIYYYNTTKVDYYKFEYQLNLGISIEPRWYFGYKNRYQSGKTKLNSGWFLSLPVSAGTTLINTHKPEIINDYYSSYKTYCSFGLTGILGYRQAISKQWFLEGNCQLINTSSQIYSLTKKLNISQFWTTIFPGISIKAAYTFK